MDRNGIIEKVSAFADEAHGDQKRKYNPSDRYIVHPLRVMKTVMGYSDDLALVLASILHDVLEDTPVKKTELYDFLVKTVDLNTALRTLQLVEELTDVYVKESYPKLNRRERKQKENDRLAKISPDAQTIKYADIIDNAPDTAEKDPDFARTYLPEYRALLKRIDKGNPDLHRLATATVNEAIRKLQDQG